MEIIAKVSKGSRMDQIYIPQKREGFSTGSYVIIKPLDVVLEKGTKKITEKPYFYNIKKIEPIKIEIVNKIIKSINETSNSKNVIITGSFLNEGFNFKDVDILIIDEDKINIEQIKKNIEKNTGIKTHIIMLSNKTLIKGLSTGPLYQMMLSRYISKKRLVYKIKRKINCKVLDLHLLKSKILIDNFDILNGNEKYYLTRNMVAILLFLENKKISNENVDKKIGGLFNIKIGELKQNILEKDRFLKKYKALYSKIFNRMMQDIKNGSKQK